MWNVQSYEEFNEYYHQQSENIHNGVWSVLISSSAEQSAEFGRRYFDLFNEISLGGWHLGVFSKKSRRNGVDIWDPDLQAHAYVDRLRAEVRGNGYRLPELCIMFIDLRKSQQNGKPVILELDATRIANTDIYEKGFKLTNEIIIKSLKSANIPSYTGIPEDKSEAFFRELHNNLIVAGIKKRVAKPFELMLSAVLGVLFGIPLTS